MILSFPCASVGTMHKEVMKNTPHPTLSPKRGLKRNEVGLKPSPEGEGLDEGTKNTMGFAKNTLPILRKIL